MAGYSLGGNLTLKLAGELGDSFPALKAVCAVSPTMDLAACVKALERRSNIAYEFNFVRRLKARMRRKATIFPEEFSLERLGRVWTVRQFDEAYTAPHHGFRDASDYYHRASALRVIDRIRVPALILTAEDDPFVPVDPFREPSVAEQPEREGRDHAARRPLRVRRARRRRLRRLLGGARGCPVRDFACRRWPRRNTETL